MIGKNINSTLIENDQTSKQREIYEGKGLGFQNSTISSIFSNSPIHSDSLVPDNLSDDRGGYLSNLDGVDEKHKQLLKSYSEMVDNDSIQGGFGFSNDSVGVNLNYNHPDKPIFNSRGRVSSANIEIQGQSDKPNFNRPNLSVNGFESERDELLPSRADDMAVELSNHEKQFGSNVDNNDTIGKYFSNLSVVTD